MHKCRTGFLAIVVTSLLCLGVWAQTCELGVFHWSVSGTVTDRPVDGSVPLQSATPVSQGVDGAMLESGIEGIRQLPSLNSLLILRNGLLIHEEYFNGHNATHSYEIASVSKSILSALVGLALEQGYFGSVHQFVAELLPEAFADTTPSKQRITIRDLLTMQAGLIWEPVAPLDLVSMQHVVSDVIALPITSGTGSRFQYSTGLPHLASAAIAEATGFSTCAFAWEHLFEPLGIAPEVWGRDADGVYTGGWYMYFTPRELARFGQLYLQGGVWEGEQILPASWVRSSLSTQVTFDDFSGYGYWWWLSSYWDPTTYVTYEIQSARGGGGQMIWLVPAMDLVMVTTSDHAYQGSSNRFHSEQFLHDVLIPAVRSGVEME